ncbi:MAG: conjugal transfer protein TraX [Lachnospiraceae bacterium]|nr:conjugal transfer protein TraX [Lachnospiraceae bacterium]
MKDTTKEKLTAFQEKIRIFPGSTLKWIALITMIIDHVAAALLYPCMEAGIYGPFDYDFWLVVYRIMRNIGRIAFPIYCFLLVEGYHYTRNKWKYLRNLAIFALVSEVPFDMAFESEVVFWNYQNVFLNLLISLLTIMTVDWALQKFCKKDKGLVHDLCWLIPTAIGGVIALVTFSDYYFFGTILTVILYRFYHNRILQGIIGYLVFTFEPWCFPSFILLQMYNGKRGRQYKYFFYAAYPVHLLIIVAIRYFCFGLGVVL